ARLRADGRVGLQHRALEEMPDVILGSGRDAIDMQPALAGRDRAEATPGSLEPLDDGLELLGPPVRPRLRQLDAQPTVGDGRGLPLDHDGARAHADWDTRRAHAAIRTVPRRMPGASRLSSAPVTRTRWCAWSSLADVIATWIVLDVPSPVGA